MRQILNFLSELSQHNDREWFGENKPRYQAGYQRFVDFTGAWLEQLAVLEPAIEGLSAKDCVWRIYRDVRFSGDKRPYKEWMGSFVAPHGGKKSIWGGYYVHLQPGQCMFAAGIWDPSPELLKALRREIEANYEEVEEIMARPDYKRYFSDFDTDYMLRRVPAGFDPEFVHADWLKRKSFTISCHLTDEQVCSPNFPELVMNLCRAAKPMNDFLNYTFEEYGEFPKRCGR